MNPFLWFLCGLTVLTVLLHLGAWTLFSPAVRRLLGRYPWLPRACHPPVLGGESVEFSTAEGAPLKGTYFRSGEGKPAGIVVFCHELNGNQWSVVPYLETLLEHDCDVLTFDFRNHGSSFRMPGYDPMPWPTSYEVADLRAAIDWVARRHEPAEPVPVVLMGISRGAAAAVAAAAGDDRVRAVVLDGLLAAESLPVRWAKAIIGWRRRCRFVALHRAMGKLRQPLLLIYGQRDRHVPTQAIEALKAATTSEAELWVVPRAGHGAAITTAAEEYGRRLGEFLNRHLAPVQEPRRAVHKPSTPAPHARSPIAAAVPSARR